MPCHPYEPGFAACVGYDVPPPRYPYGPGLPTSDAPAPTLPGASSVAPLVVATPPPPDDELRLDRTASVPEPSVVLLTVIALATLWRARRTVR